LSQIEKNCYGQPIDRSGAVWRVNSSPEVTIRREVRDTTAEMGLTRPNIWSEGGTAVDISVKFQAFIPVGAKAPDWNVLAEQIAMGLSAMPLTEGADN
jgi:hypothetical protein